MRGSAVFRTGVAPGGALAGPWVRDPLWTRARAVPSLDLRFADNKSLVDAVTGASLVTFTRASSGTFVGSDGLIQTAATNEPRFDHNPTTGESLGLLVEEARTNSITNNTMVGAVAGTPGTLPTGWNRNVTQNGITQNVAGVGVINGISYVDIRFQGTATGSGYTDVAMGSATAAQNQTWAFSAYLAMVGGSTANITSGGLTLYGSPTFSDNGSVIWLSTIGSNLTANSRFSAVRTFTNVLTNSANFRLTISATAGAAVDITLRIGLPQLEQGAFATSVIPTTSATVTRAADVASIGSSAFTSFYNQSEGTMFVDFLRAYSGNFPNFPNLYQFNDGTNDNEITVFGIQGGQLFQPSVIIGASSQVNFVTFASIFPGPNRCAHSLSLNNSVFAGNGVLTTPDTSVNLPTVNQVKFGERGGQRFTGHYKRICFWRQALPGATLQAITG